MFALACHRFLVLVIGLLISAPLAADKPNERPFWRTVVMGTNGMAAAEHPLECRAAIKALEAGGNAIDAAVASFYMTTVVEQHQAGIGGDGFILAYLAKEDRVIFINGTGPAPKLATAEFYRKLGKIPDAGPYSTDVPGMAGGFDLALKKYGTMSYEKLLEPVIDAAGRGHPLSFWASSYHRKTIPKLSPFPSSIKTLLKNGGPYEPGDLFVQKDLAKTLETIAKEGAEAFYRGRLARLSADFYKKQKGLLRYEDLASYEPEEAEPIKTTYADLEVYQSAPNSQGIVMLMALNILEGFALDEMGYNSPEYIHVVTEALKLAFADRNKYIADPRFATDMPVEGLLSKAYAKKRRSLIRMDKTLAPPPPPGDPRNHKAVLGDGDVRYANGKQAILEGPYENTDGETSSFSIADRFGNLVSVTHSVNGTFGSGMIVEGGGYVLNNRMPYFSLAEDDVNFLVPGKRTRHTVNPALALKNGRPYLAWNTPGGDNQPQAMLQAFLNVVVFDMNIQQAVEAPTVTSYGFGASMYPQPVKGTLAMPRVLANEVGEGVSKLGHRIEVIEMQQPYQQQPSGAGAVKMVMVDSERGVLMGGVSPAKDDYVMGW